MSLDEPPHLTDDPAGIAEIEQLERMLRSTTPEVTPPSMGLLERIRERRRRRKQVASGLGAIALLAGSISLGLFAVRTSGPLAGTEATITTVPDGRSFTAADVDRWLADGPPGSDNSSLFVASPVPPPDAVRQFVGCAWVNEWRDALESQDTAAASTAFSALEASDEWSVMAFASPELETFAQLATASRFAEDADAVERSALWQRCEG